AIAAPHSLNHKGQPPGSPSAARAPENPQGGRWAAAPVRPRRASTEVREANFTGPRQVRQELGAGSQCLLELLRRKQHALLAKREQLVPLVDDSVQGIQRGESGVLSPRPRLSLDLQVLDGRRPDAAAPCSAYVIAFPTSRRAPPPAASSSALRACSAASL